MEIKLKEIGERVRQIRKGINLNQEAFGVLIGVKSSTVSKYENGESDAGAITFNAIAKLGDKSLDWLITGKDPESSNYPASAFDWDLHSEITIMIGEVGADLDIKIKPGKLGDIIKMIYEESIAGNEVTRAKVIQLIKLAA
ncbi:MAG: helix-turn-helix transcriptional regulator [Desulfuromusa sp.]